MRQINLDKRGARYTSPFRGVSYYYRSNKWQAVIREGGKMRHLGYVVDEIEAARAYDEAARVLYWPIAALNEPLIQEYLRRRPFSSDA